MPGIVTLNRQNYAQDLQELRRADAGAEGRGRAGALGYVLAGSRFETAGYRDHSAATAPRYAVVGARIGLEQRMAGLTLREFVRVDNLADRRYAGSVIVGDANGRSFEPAPGRNWSAGVTLLSTF